MAVSITAVANDSYHSPGVILTVTGLTGYTTVTITRKDDAAVLPDAKVRGADSSATSGDTFMVTDYEAPIGRVTYYTALAESVSTSESDDSSTVILTVSNTGAVWLKSVGQPALSRRVNVVDFSDRQRPRRILGEYEVLGRENKVVLTDTLGGREGDLTLSTFLMNGVWETDHSWQDVSRLLSDGGTLFLQTAGYDYTGEEDMYLEVKGYARKRIGPVGGELTHLHTIEYVEVDRPATSEQSLSLRSWQDVLNENATWQAVIDGYADWLEVVQGV